MTTEVVIRALSLYWPLLTFTALALWWRPGYFARVGLLLALCWNLSVLPIVSWAATELGWWSFKVTGPQVLGMPLEFYFGWAVWWGGVMPLIGLQLFRRSLAWYLAGLTGLALAVDAILMPQLTPVLELSSDWWWGEAVLLVTVLWPGALVVWWTKTRSALAGRVLVQAGTFSVGLFLLVPCLEAGGWGWLREGFAERSAWMMGGFGAVVGLFGLLGGSAVWEFAKKGGGTPVPFDPPLRLVTTGVYRYVANPMQVAMTGLMLAWGLWFDRGWLLILAGIGVVYSEGLARWSERIDHRERFGDAWAEYRSRVGRWWVRRSPKK